MFKTRLVSGIVLIAIAIAVLVYGSYPLFGTIAVISLIGLFELYRAVGMEKTAPAVAGNDDKHHYFASNALIAVHVLFKLLFVPFFPEGRRIL